MASNDMILYLLAGVGGLFGIIVIIYIILRNKMSKSDAVQIQNLRVEQKKSSFSTEIIYQKLYTTYFKTPFLKRYLLKIRRRLEIINLDDEYLTRLQSAQKLTNTLAIVIPLTIAIIVITKNNALLMSILLIFELFLVDSILDGMVDKIDNNLLLQQIDFFAEIRHAYHEFNMVEEAIYQVAQEDDNTEMARQAEKIYEILISDDPEMELEKYYDTAPNNYLKEFAGISYITKEFGDRKEDKASLYLKNLNNISQEMQLEILKRDKLNYVFQSLSLISIAPLLVMEPIKAWAVKDFSFTSSFYNGKKGMIVQLLVVVVTFLCYTMTRKLKDNGSTKITTNDSNPWEEKVYTKPIAKQIVDAFIPREGTKDRRKLTNLMKDAASKKKLSWFYVDRLVLTVLTFIASIIMMAQIHKLEVDYIYNEPTATYDLVGEMSEKDMKTAMQLTESDNKFLDKFKYDTQTTRGRY